MCMIVNVIIFLAGHRFGVFGDSDLSSGYDSDFSSGYESSGSVSTNDSRYYDTRTGETAAKVKLRALSKKATRFFRRQSST